MSASRAYQTTASDLAAALGGIAGRDENKPRYDVFPVGSVGLGRYWKVCEYDPARKRYEQSRRTDNPFDFNGWFSSPGKAQDHIDALIEEDRRAEAA